MLLKQGKVSAQLACIMIPPFGMRGLNWLQKHWPEDRLRKELPGYVQVSDEWNLLLSRRLVAELAYHIINHHSSRVMRPSVCPCCSRGPGKKLMDCLDKIFIAYGPREF